MVIQLLNDAQMKETKTVLEVAGIAKQGACPLVSPKMPCPVMNIVQPCANACVTKAMEIMQAAHAESAKVTVVVKQQ